MDQLDFISVDNMTHLLNFSCQLSVNPGNNPTWLKINTSKNPSSYQVADLSNPACFPPRRQHNISHHSAQLTAAVDRSSHVRFRPTRKTTPSLLHLPTSCTEPCGDDALTHSPVEQFWSMNHADFWHPTGKSAKRFSGRAINPSKLRQTVRFFAHLSHLRLLLLLSRSR